jgi:hypothetical protein
VKNGFSSVKRFAKEGEGEGEGEGVEGVGGQHFACNFLALQALSSR